jgi:hypothetical protein
MNPHDLHKVVRSTTDAVCRRLPLADSQTHGLRIRSEGASHTLEIIRDDDAFLT